MYRTPNKKQDEQFKSLRNQIQTKLSSSKKLSQHKRTYQSNNKSIQQSNRISINNSLHCKKYQTSKKINHFSNQISSKYQSQSQPKITESNILEYENGQHPGFFGFKQWIQFHKKYFPQVQATAVENLWKVIRILNYGQILIPSGLIFQLAKNFSTIQNQKQHRKLDTRMILNNFLKMNNIEDQIDSFRQLKFYPSIQSIEKEYKNLTKNLQKSDKLGFTQLNLQKYQQKPVFDRVYEDAGARSHRNTQNIYKNLVNLKLQEQILFQPQINSNFPATLFPDEVQRPKRICHEQQKWRTKDTEQQSMTMNRLWKATEYNRNNFEETSLQQIPGVKNHVNRNKYSQATKQKLLRYHSKPSLIFKHDI